MIRSVFARLNQYKWHIMAVAGTAVAYDVATLFRPSAVATVAEIQAAGAHAVQRPDGRVVEYFLHGAPLETASSIILALHGAQTTGNLFSLLDPWAKKNDVAIVAPSLPGFGLTTWLPEPGSAEASAAWVADMDALLTQVEAPLAQKKAGKEKEQDATVMTRKKFHVLGTSMGSIFAARLAGTLPNAADRLGNLELTVAFAPPTDGEQNPLDGSILQVFASLQPHPWAKRFLEKRFVLPMLRALSPSDGDVARSFRTQWEGVASCTGWIMSKAMWSGFDWTALQSPGNKGGGGDDDTSAKKRRVIIVSCRQDQAAPPHNQRRLYKGIAGSTLVEFDGKHEEPLLDPEMFGRQVAMLLEAAE